MSYQFNDTSNDLGLVQRYEDAIGANRGDISGNTAALKKFAAYTRAAYSRYLPLALNASGTWQFDDSNHTDHPIITTNLVDGQRDYPITTDGTNLVLDILKVAILPSATATLYEEISPIDAQSDSAAANLVANNTAEGVPFQYDKTGNSIFLDPIPSYSATNGLRVYINRENSFFTYSDTTKKPGVPGVHHDYFYLYPAYLFKRDNGFQDTEQMYRDVLKLEDEIKRYFGKRTKDERPIIKPKITAYL